jgi:choline kinase
MEDPLEDAETLKMNAGGEIIEIGKKPSSLDEIQAQYVGLILFRSAVCEKVKQFYRGLDRNGTYDGKDFDNMYMTSFLTQILEELHPVSATKIRGGWCEVDTLDDLEVYGRSDLEVIKRLESL